MNQKSKVVLAHHDRLNNIAMARILSVVVLLLTIASVVLAANITCQIVDLVAQRSLI